MCLVWRKLAQLFWRRKKYLDFVNVFSLFWCLLLENSATLHLNKIESPSPKDAFYQVWLKLAQWNFVYVFLLFRYYHLSFRAWPFIFTNLNPLYPMILCAKFGWNWPTGSGRRELKCEKLKTPTTTTISTTTMTDIG